MKRITTILALIILCGCKAQVSITEHGSYTEAKVRGSGRALEKKLAELFDQMTGDYERDKIAWKKINLIQENLWLRGYFVKQPFLLPNVIYTHTKVQELGKVLTDLESGKRSIGASLMISPANPELHRGSAIRVTISDKTENIKNWEMYLKTIDKGLKAEQQIEPYQN